MVQRGERRRKGGLQTDNAVRSLLKIRLFLRRVGRVVGDYAVDRAVYNALGYRLDVSRRAQRRVHSVVRVAAAEQLVGQHEIMRSSLAGHHRAESRRGADILHALRGGNVRNVNRHFQVGGKRYLALCYYILAQAVDTLHAEFLRYLAEVHDTAVDYIQILAVGDDLHSRVVSLHHSLSHYAGVLYRSAVVGDRHAARLMQLLKVAHLSAAQPLGNAPDRIDACLRFLRLFKNVMHRFCIVYSGVGVRHARYRSHAASRRRISAGDDIFLVGLSGVAEMHVHIAYSRDHRQPGAVHRLSLRCGDVLHDLAYPVIVDKDIRLSLEAAGAVNHIAVFQ